MSRRHVEQGADASFPRAEDIGDPAEEASSMLLAIPHKCEVLGQELLIHELIFKRATDGLDEEASVGLLCNVLW